MPIDERELRSRLAQTAARAGAPRFTAEDVAGRVRRIRRRRRNRAWVASLVTLAAVTPTVVIPLTVGGAGEPAVVSSPATVPQGPSFRVTVNGQTSLVPGTGGVREYYVTAGQKLTITVDVTAPARTRITALSIGISDGVLGPPMQQVLASTTRLPPGPGSQRFVLHWTAPAGLAPENIRLLAAYWAYSGSGTGTVDQAIAEFVAPPPGPAFSAAAVGKLRALALQEAGSCDEPRPAWITAVRTSYGRAEAAMGEPVTGYAGQEVYLIVMKGDFTAYHAEEPPCVGAPPGHYFYTVVDAATFEWMSRWLTNRPPPVPLRTLGPVRNLT